MSTPAESLQSVLTPSDQLAVTSDGDLTIEGAVAADLIARFGSPLFVFSEATLRANYRRARDAFAAVWPGPVNVMFAIKCNPNMAVRAVLHDEGAGGDCFGIPEIEATFAGGADPDKIALNGGNKTAEELERAIELGITINMDAAEEIDDVVAAARKVGKSVRVNIRLKVVPPEFEHFVSDAYLIDGDFRPTLQRWKWGVTQETAIAMVERLKGEPDLDWTGWHTHYGRMSARAEDYRAFQGECARMIGAVATATGVAPRVIDMGGGWARERDPESRSADAKGPPIEKQAQAVVGALRHHLEGAGLDTSKIALWAEPGRYIAGNAAVMLTSIGTIKSDAGYVWFNVEASENNLPAICKEGSANHVTVASGMHRKADAQADIVGPICIPSVLA
ncbi:MAG: diaminopimelate decarboxylase, partial [Rhodospirillaceae bacterium]|nr:diaminopimelate decarboxylase [Rhodospirillaceae bacterium]